MNRLRWIGIQITEQLGLVGATALALLIACALFYLGEVSPLQQQLRALRTNAVPPGGPQASTVDPAIKRFKQIFQAKALEEQLKAIDEAGRAAGLTIKHVEYRMLDEKRFELKQYQIVMPVTSSYPRIRQFVSLALAKVPTLALDQISFQRKKVGDPSVEAELRFTLFLAGSV